MPLFIFRMSNLIIKCIVVSLFIPVFFMSATAAETGISSVRRPVWAGRFYPADRKELARTIETLMARAAAGSKTGARRDHGHSGHLRALVFPHAGYEYSGEVAARSALELEGRSFSTVIIMGPDHRVGFRNAALTPMSFFETPLAITPVSPKASLLREKGDLFRSVPLSDRTEHSIEAVMPFLQYALKDFQVVPLVVGPCDARVMSRAIYPLVDDRTLVVVSSDLSHYLSGDAAREHDRKTIDMILGLDAHALSSMENSACGIHALLILMDMAQEHGWVPELLMYKNSGDATGDYSRVVGYASIAFYQYASTDKAGGAAHGEKQVHFLSSSQGQALVKLARETIRAAFRKDVGEVPADLSKQPALNAHRGTFVTLTKHGMLRGCMGNIIPRDSIIESVRRNALNAAFNDYRFSPLRQDELDDIHVEVSILTRPRLLNYSGPHDLVSKLEPGVDGVIITSREGASATYLPQVWKQLPDPGEFLSRLCRKAGLPGDAWRRGRLEVQTYRVQYFDEPDG